MLTKTDFTELWLPRMPKATNNFSIQPGLVSMPKKEALDYRWFNTNVTKMKNLLTVDIDMEQSEWYIKGLVEEEGILPEPSFITVNPASEHAQVGWFIEGFVKSDKSVEWFTNINKGLTALAGGDAAYGGYTMRNPTHPYQNTIWGTDHLYSLQELNTFTSKRKMFEPKISEATEMISGRNVAMFDALRKWGYRAKLRFNNYSDWSIAITERANELNFSFGSPLPHSEVKSIVNSVSRWIWNKNFNEETFRKIQTYRSHKRQVVKDAPQRAENIMVMVESGFTIKEVAENLGISYDAAKISIRRSKQRLNK